MIDFDHCGHKFIKKIELANFFCIFLSLGAKNGQMARWNSHNNDKQGQKIENGYSSVFTFGQYDLFRFAIPNGDQNYRDKHHYPMFNGKITRGIVLHGIAVELHERA